jgi:hypothetical protein
LFEKRVLRKTFESKKDEVTRGWRKLHNEQLNNLYPSRSIIRMIKSRMIRWAGHLAGMGGKEIVSWWESQKERDY